MVTTQKNTPLGQLTSFGVGGPAEVLHICQNYADVLLVLQSSGQPEQTLGFGTNILISDEGLSGVTIIARGGDMELNDTLLVADAGVWWDDVVSRAVGQQLWGIELMSGIPSSVGGAVVGNIAAYGQQISESLAWVDIFDADTASINRVSADTLTFGYRSSSLQQTGQSILRAGFQLSQKMTTELTYESANSVARSRQLDPNNLQQRQQIIIETRREAGSLYNPDDTHRQHTAGSFFKNPRVDMELAKELSRFDESGKSLDRILAQNRVHGGGEARVSAAHVLLAAGFHRGQTWGSVRLHKDHVLKLENIGSATAQEIYDVAQYIMKTVHQKFAIKLEPEVKFLGKFI